MRDSRSVSVVALGLVSALSACSGIPPEREESLAPGIESLLLVSQGPNTSGAGSKAIASTSISTLIQIPDADSAGGSNTRVLHEYHAASGLSCRRIRLSETPSVRVSCMRRNGEWTLTRALVASEPLAEHVHVPGEPLSGER